MCVVVKHAMNNSSRVLLIDINDQFWPIDEEWLAKHNQVNPFFLILLLFLYPFLCVLLIAFCTSLFQEWRAHRSWSLAWRLSTKKIARSFATSSRHSRS